MSIEEELKRRKKAKKAKASSAESSNPIGLAARHPDKIMLSTDFAEKSNQYWIRYAKGKGGDPLPYVRPDTLWRFKDQLLKKKMWDRKEVPRWVANSLEESKWGYDVFWEESSRGVAYLIDNRVIIQSPFIVTLHERLNRLKCRSITFSEDARGWALLDYNIEDSALLDILREYNITPSPRLWDTINGLADWRATLGQHVKRAKLAGYKIPDMFPSQRTLKDHQVDAVLASTSLRQTILADQVGLGKTGEAIMGYLSIVQHELEKGTDSSELWPYVMVTTASLKHELVEEITKWKEDAVIEVLTGTASIPIDEGVEFVVLNIDILNSRKDDIMATEPKAFFIDEAHMVKNRGAKRTQAAREVAEDLFERLEDPFIMLASGTPFLNGPHELFSLLEILRMSEYFSDYAANQEGVSYMKVRTKKGWRRVPASPQNFFERRWCAGEYDRFNNWIVGSSNEFELNRLLLENVMIRRRKTDVMHPLPELNEGIIPVELSYEDRIAYDEKANEFRDWFIEFVQETADEEGISITEAVRIAHKKLNSAEHVMRMTALRQEVARAKVGPIKEWIHRFMDGDPEITGGDSTRDKIIVFAHHREIQALLIDDEELQQYGLVYMTADNKNDHQTPKKRFQTDPRCRIMICYSGAREGHTLTAAKDVLLAEVPFVPSWVVQMAGRCWARLSEEFPPHEAYVHYAIAPGTIDSSIFNKVRLKKATFSQVIDAEGQEEVGGVDDDGSQEAADVIMEMFMSGTHKIKIAS